MIGSSFLGGRHFARSGFACLAWDKPGVGRSSGDFNAQTFRDRAEESLAALYRSEAGGRKEALAKAPKIDVAPAFVPGYLDLMTAWLRQRCGP